ncbi:MAG TPA: hypothetical protein DCO77_02780 [Nitrospiraceae bacterium]|nr:hypothetical protein [Nitrospiraceae bacterium]
MKKLLLMVIAVTVFASCSLATMEVRSKGVMLEDDTVIHYLEAGQGPTLILIHGIGGSSASWRDVIPSLSKAYRVIALDLPGYGKSDRPRVDYSVEYYATVLKHTIDAVGGDRVALVGNSLGGWIAAVTALNHPQSVSHLILVDSAGLKGDPPPSVNLDPATQKEFEVLLQAFYHDTTRLTTEFVDNEWKYRKSVRRTIQETMKSLNTKSPSLDGRLRGIKAPTLVIWGKQDKLIPVEVAGRFAKGIPTSTVTIIDNAGHMPHIEQPKAFYRSVKKFVKSW